MVIRSITRSEQKVTWGEEQFAGGVGNEQHFNRGMPRWRLLVLH
jgi:hypothetical protein